MTATPEWQLPVSERSLNSMTRDLDEAHREAYPAMRAQASAFAEELRESGARRAAPERRVARRGFLAGIGGLGAMAALAACSSSGSGQNPDTRAGAGTSYSTGGASPYTGDLKVVALATALENQAVGAYQAALSAAQAGKLGTVPPAVATFMQTAMSQHQEHAKAWNSALTGAGTPAISGVPLSNQAATVKSLDAATSVGDVAKLALQLEDQAAETYLFAVGNVSSAGGIATAASIAPVEAMHAAVLLFVLGEYPVPEAFLGTNLAASPTLLTV